MPIDAQSLIPSRARPEIVIGVVMAVNGRKVVVAISPDVRVNIIAEGYFPGQRVFVGAPGGELANAQILGPATGEATAVGHVLL